MPSYDEDYQDPEQRCIHGTFIGSWWGPDYLCGYCEDGTSLDDFQAIGHYRTISAATTAPGHTADNVLRTLWETAPATRPWVLSALAGNTVHGYPSVQFYEQYVHEELAIAHANLQLAILGMELVK